MTLPFSTFRWILLADEFGDRNAFPGRAPDPSVAVSRLRGRAGGTMGVDEDFRGYNYPRNRRKSGIRTYGFRVNLCNYLIEYFRNQVNISRIRASGSSNNFSKDFRTRIKFPPLWLSGSKATF